MPKIEVTIQNYDSPEKKNTRVTILYTSRKKKKVTIIIYQFYRDPHIFGSRYKSGTQIYFSQKKYLVMEGSP